jgi:hypothetical protein
VRFHRLSKIEYRWGEHAHSERCRMTQNWTKLAADLELVEAADYPVRHEALREPRGD